MQTLILGPGGLKDSPIFYSKVEIFICLTGEEHQRRAHRQPEVGSHRSRLHLMVHYRVPTQIRRSVTLNHFHLQTEADILRYHWE